MCRPVRCLPKMSFLRWGRPLQRHCPMVRPMAMALRGMPMGFPQATLQWTEPPGMGLAMGHHMGRQVSLHP